MTAEVRPEAVRLRLPVHHLQAVRLALPRLRLPAHRLPVAHHLLAHHQVVHRLPVAHHLHLVPLPAEAVRRLLHLVAEAVHPHRLRHHQVHHRHHPLARHLEVATQANLPLAIVQTATRFV
jgi:hypothetical protein